MSHFRAVLNRTRSHISGNAVAYLALFIALGGTSYGLAAGSIDSREIKNNTVRTGDLRNNEVRSRDIRNRTIVGRDHLSNSLGGDQVDETELGEVPLATRSESADNALAVGGRAASTIGSAPLTATVSFEDGEQGTVLNVPGQGRLYVASQASEDCDTGGPAITLRWENLGGVQQSLYGVSAVPGISVIAENVNPGANEAFDASGDTGYYDAIVRPTNSATSQTRVTAFVGIGGDFGSVCRVSAQAVSSG
jgi:hypothetical protein